MNDLLKFARWKIELCEKLAFLPVFGMRLWIGNIFWKSGQTKLADWSATVSLFADEYKVPVISPDIAAHMATAVELTAPVLLAIGLGSRVAAFAMLVMTGVIEFTYMHFDEHVIWALVLTLIILQGPGKASADYFIRRKFLP